MNTVENKEFTENETAVLRAAYDSMYGNGFDFGFVAECRPEGMDAKSAGAVLRVLRKKLQLWSDDEFGQLCANWVPTNDQRFELDGQPYYGATFEVWLAAIARV